MEALPLTSSFINTALKSEPGPLQFQRKKGMHSPQCELPASDTDLWGAAVWEQTYRLGRHLLMTAGKMGTESSILFFLLKWRLRSCRENTRSRFTIQVLTLSCHISDYTDVEFVTSVSLSITLMTFCLVTVDRTCTLIRKFYLTLHNKGLLSSVSLSDVMMCWYWDTTCFAALLMWISKMTKACK